MAPYTTSVALTETATTITARSSPLFDEDLFASLDDASSVTTSSTSSSTNGSHNSTTSKTKTNGGGDIEYLPVEYRPSDTTVILGRGKQIKMHAGNRRLQARIQQDLAVYTAADCHKTVKSSMVAQIVHDICAMNDHRVGFVKLDTSCKRWYQVTVLAARTTVAQAFRDANQGKNYRSSKQSKRRRRLLEKMQEVKQEDRVSQKLAAEAAVSSMMVRPPPPPVAVAVSPSPSLSSSKSPCQQQQLQQLQQPSLYQQQQRCVAPPQVITLQSACQDATRQVRQQLLQLQQEHLQLQMMMLQQQQQMLLTNPQNTNQVASDGMLPSFSTVGGSDGPGTIRQQYQRQQQGLFVVANNSNMNHSEPLLMPDNTTTMIMSMSNHNYHHTIQDSSSDRLSAILDDAVRAADAAAAETMEDDLSSCCGGFWEDPFEPVPIDEEAMVMTSDLFEI